MFVNSEREDREFFFNYGMVVLFIFDKVWSYLFVVFAWLLDKWNIDRGGCFCRIYWLMDAVF